MITMETIEKMWVWFWDNTTTELKFGVVIASILWFSVIAIRQRDNAKRANKKWP